ncbi:MAG: NADH-quinone oxidoreductase subunit NuoE [Actinobacteria bacterium HGW-Actinobacteria-7]|nr:MAG: NADH-quinone oxidoreductase subunit NuoE [Actinobacteria bacterium HGW-Actinobacteria-7]
MSECSCTSSQSPEFDATALEAILSSGSTVEGALVPILQASQDAYGYLPRPALEMIARSLRLPLAEVYGVATFYAQFHLEPRGKHIVRICHGTACHVRGATEITDVIVGELGVEVGSTSEDLSFTVESVACVGCCGLAPVVLIDGETHGGLSTQAARRIVSKLQREQTQ